MTAQPLMLNKSSQGREQRRDVRRTLGAAGSVRVHLTVGTETVACRVIDISPGGMGLVTNQILSTRLPTVAMDVRVIYRKGTRDEVAMPGTVRNVNFEMFGDKVVVRLGLSFGTTAWDEGDDGLIPLFGPGENTPDQRTLDRITRVEKEHEAAERFVTCPALFQPAGFCEDPFFFQERIHFQVLAFSPTWLRLACSARNKSLLPGLVMKLSVFLPLVGLFDVAVKLDSTRLQDESDRYVIEASIVMGDGATSGQTARTFLQNVARYLVVSGAVASVDELSTRGFPLRDVERFLQFQVARGEEDLARVDAFWRGRPVDPSARLVLCRLGADLLGVGQIAFVRRGGARSVVETRIARIPSTLVEKGYAEVSWFCGQGNTHIPDAFVHFVKNFSRMAMEAGVPTVLTTCRVETWPVYRALGFENVKCEFLPAFAEPATTHVVSLDVQAVLRGRKSVSRGIWMRIYEPIAVHLGLIEGEKAS